MVFNPLDTQSWNRAFSIWISDIQVCFQEPVVELVKLSGGFLRWVRGGSRLGAGMVALLFSLHCTKPRVPELTPTGTPAPLSGGQDGRDVYTETGQASWYGGDDDGFAGRPTATGETFDPERFTCAHRTLPLGTCVEVVNLDNGRRAILRVNDRGPFARGRILDVSFRAARELGFRSSGTASIRIRTVNLDGSPARVDPSRDLGDPFTVQVGSFGDPANLKRLVKVLQEHFQDVSVQDSTLRDGRRVTRVRVGTFTREEEARRLAERIQRTFGDRGVEPFVTRRGKSA